MSRFNEKEAFEYWVSVRGMAAQGGIFRAAPFEMKVLQTLLHESCYFAFVKKMVAGSHKSIAI